MLRIFLASALLISAPAGLSAAEDFDVVIYGGTSSGIVAALQAARMGKRAVVIEPGEHLGGLTSGGLGATDIGNKQAIGGIAREFYRRIYAHYSRPQAWKQETREHYQSKRQKPGEDTMWTFEPHVAEDIYRRMLAERQVPVFFGERLDLRAGVQRQGKRITAIRMESGRVFGGRMFIDASYEGDLMAKAGVAYTVGRESNSAYDETLDGVQLGSKKHQFKLPVDPYRTPGDPTSGLLPGIHAGSPGEHGQGDRRVQAYNFRMCMTDAPENRLPFPKPAGYDPLRYELLLRYMQAGEWDVIGNNAPMPNRKTDTNNNGAVSTDNIGMNYDYPDGDYATRERIWREHVQYQQGLMWFLANDPRVPAKVRQEINRWGLARDEFADTGGWPHQLYVREARRMIADVVMTEQHCQGEVLAAEPVGLAAYGMDSHNTQRYVDETGHARNEGDVEVHGFSPYPIAYRSIVPKAGECGNLLVPVCLSASHIAYGSIRMEPVFMVLGQSAATAACQAIDAGRSVQEIDTKALAARLLADDQVLEWKGPKRRSNIDPRRLPGIVMDDTQAQLEGDWVEGQTTGGFICSHYLHDGRQQQGAKRARFVIPIEKSGSYEVRLAYTTLANRATNVPVTIEAADGQHQVTVNERREPAVDKLFQPLGTFRFERGKPAVVVVSNAKADGYVIVDAVQLLPKR
ncbi:MAG TPA: FAD-dependent oxidoreductase [Pirellulales bacterium]|jgi:hypothetical protein|nr:FAD-dependent oxidoreductase [Pirellulales bacterium]